jgi:hypothetical protein
VPFLNDLWKFDGTNWTWVSGSSTGMQAGTYGTKGTPAGTNVPGARYGSVSWTDAAGNLWLFGGNGCDSTGPGGYLNDLWKFDGAHWTWVSGSSTISQPGTYGTKGAPASANVPGCRADSVSWIDPAGHLWLFGGAGYDSVGTATSYLNDLWKFDGTNWTWVSGSSTGNQAGTYGTEGIPSSANVPGSRYVSVSWTDPAGQFWLFGGYGYDSAGTAASFLNDLWKFDGTNWTWVSGSSTQNQLGTYGTKGAPASTNMPGARWNSVSWTDPAGGLWLFGGGGSGSGAAAYLNDFWKFDGTNWTWVSGPSTSEHPGSYGTKGTTYSTNVPGARNGAVSWTDPAGTFWLFGGSGLDSTGVGTGALNDLWKFDGAHWTWVSGSSTGNQVGTYGTKGTPAGMNVPGARFGSISWTDPAGNLWLFGGFGYDSVGTTTGDLNDLWKFDGTNWTWVSGSSTSNQAGTYGTKGAPDSANIPGARDSSVSWTDPAGHLWLFGGLGYDSAGSSTGALNDLWEFDGTNWVWISGSSIGNQAGTYGTKGTPAGANVPDARWGAVSWTDPAGKFWLFGGVGYNSTTPSTLNDLWKCDGTEWTWVSGSSTPGRVGTYGTKGTPDNANVPGGRAGSVSWTDSAGNLWLFGGSGLDSTGVGTGALNDLWKFDGTNWAWVSGSSTMSQLGVYGTKGTPASTNEPGARYGSISWLDSAGNLWLFGGTGFDTAGLAGLDDLWRYRP